MPADDTGAGVIELVLDRKLILGRGAGFDPRFAFRDADSLGDGDAFRFDPLGDGLARPEFAESAIVDLARWQDWDALPEVTSLFTKAGFAQPAVRRAVVGYLLACPEQRARLALASLRALDAAGVAEAEQVLSTTGSVPQAS